LHGRSFCSKAAAHHAQGRRQVADLAEDSDRAASRNAAVDNSRCRPGALPTSVAAQSADLLCRAFPRHGAGSLRTPATHLRDIVSTFRVAAP
jgi:hypothetical protein